MKETKDENLLIKSLDQTVDKVNDVEVKLGVIKFNEYETMLKKANEVADYINSIELNDENVKDVKKVLADARKISSALNSKRIEIKKYLEQPYKEFEKQIKDIDNVINIADEKLRVKVREQEEKEREEKERQLEEIWKLRVKHYTFGSYLDNGFKMFLQPAHLNKSNKISNVEDEMVAFMEKTQTELNTMLAMNNSSDIIYEYSLCYNLAVAIQTFKNKEEQKKKISEATKEDGEVEEILTFTVKGAKDIKLTKMLLDENKISYEEG